MAAIGRCPAANRQHGDRGSDAPTAEGEARNRLCRRGLRECRAPGIGARNATRARRVTQTGAGRRHRVALRRFLRASAPRRQGRVRRDGEEIQAVAISLLPSP